MRGRRLNQETALLCTIEPLEPTPALGMGCTGPNGYDERGERLFMGLGGTLGGQTFIDCCGAATDLLRKRVSRVSDGDTRVKILYYVCFSAEYM